jgi:hypothetical protein
MHRRAHRSAVLLSVLALALVGACQSTSAPSSDGSPASRAELSSGQTGRAFTFGAAGDLGATANTARSLRKLDASAAEFFLALGDLDYDMTPSDRAWCRYVKKRLPTKGAAFPFELVAGNHEQDGGPDGRIGNFAACLPDRMGSEGTYAAQYSFTYPRTDPFAKLIMIAPRLTVDGHRYTYGPRTADRRWLVRQIDDARAAGIPWVIVGMHHMCLSTGTDHPGCDSGHAVHNLLLRKRVDLLLDGHNHIYERSKQLAFSAACPRIPPGEYDPACVVDDGSDASYAHGAGAVQVTAGRFGARPAGLDRNDPDAPYFARLASGTTGWMRYTITPDRIDARYVSSSGTLRDAFSIH